MHAPEKVFKYIAAQPVQVDIAALSKRRMSQNMQHRLRHATVRTQQKQK